MGESDDVNPYGNLDQNQNMKNKNQDNYSNIRKQKTPLQKLEKLPQNTLDQGCCDTFLSQVKGVCHKFGYVLIPRTIQDENEVKLKNWDLWGPFFICLMFAFFIQDSNQFLAILFIVFLGAIVVTFNLRVLGGTVSFFQSVSILGYCIGPLFIALVVIEFLKFIEVKNHLINTIIVIVATLWCVLASRNFVGVNIPDNKRFVSIYPIILFYAFLGVMLAYHQ